MRGFAGEMGSVQVVYSTKMGETGLTFAGGLLSIEANPGDPDAALLLDGNGGRDYEI